MKNVQLKTLEQLEQLKPSQLPIGSKFKFAFELSGQWTYQKINKNQIMCIEAPLTNKSCVNEILPLLENNGLAVVAL